MGDGCAGVIGPVPWKGGRRRAGDHPWPAWAPQVPG